AALFVVDHEIYGDVCAIWPTRIRRGAAIATKIASASSFFVSHGPLRVLAGACIPQDARYSITSSARCCNTVVMDRPNAFAVFMLITSSNFAGDCTGRSLGFSPRRMRLI